MTSHLPAVIATIRAAVDDTLHGRVPQLGDLPYEITEAILAGLDAEGWEIVRRDGDPEEAS